MNAILLDHPIHFPDSRADFWPDIKRILKGFAKTLIADVHTGHRRLVRLFDNPVVSALTWIILACAVVGAQVEWTAARFAR